MDRFLMKIFMESLTRAQEIALAERFLKDAPLEQIGAVCTKDEIVALQQDCKEIAVHPDLMGYMVDLCQATRKDPKVQNGVSPRGTLAFVRGARAYAMVQGRSFVTPEDVKAVAVPILAHRLTMNVSMDSDKAAVAVIEHLLQSVALPTEEWERR